MNISSIPVDLGNPGQVFACLGLLEAADRFYGAAEACFDWKTEKSAQFMLKSEHSKQPVADILSFLANAKALAIAPNDWVSPKGKVTDLVSVDTFPAKEPDSTALPIMLRDAEGRCALLSHWADQSRRDNFKLYAGNRSAQKIANDMLREVSSLWDSKHEQMVEAPFNVLCSMGGSFNFDPRGSWTGLDVGYSINDLKKAKVLEQKVIASPVVEILAAWGMEHARPAALSLRNYRYVIWDCWLPPQLARVALSGDFALVERQCYQFQLDMSGKNKIIRYAIEETSL